MVQETTFKASGPNDSVSSLEAFVVHSISAVGLAIALWVSHNLHSINLSSHPSETLFFIWVTGCPIAILIYSRYRQSPQCSYFRAVGHGIIGLLAGALICAFGAVALGAPISSRYILKTINWSLTMSLFTVVPAASVFGSSWTDWQRIFAHTMATGSIDFMICIPAHGALLGAWFGAWPMPLDWERQWQEWPIIVTYGSIAGYLIGVVGSFGFVLYHNVSKRTKTD